MQPKHDSISARIAWCRRQRDQARTESEAEEWRAEENGLRDALLNMDRADAYRVSTAEVLRRYTLGLRDGRALLQVAWVSRVASDVATESATVAHLLDGKEEGNKTAEFKLFNRPSHKARINT